MENQGRHKKEKHIDDAEYREKKRQWDRAYYLKHRKPPKKFVSDEQEELIRMHYGDKAKEPKTMKELSAITGLSKPVIYRQAIKMGLVEGMTIEKFREQENIYKKVLAEMKHGKQEK